MSINTPNDRRRESTAPDAPEANHSHSDLTGVTRRRALISVASVGVATLAGCLGGDDGDAGDGDDGDGDDDSDGSEDDASGEDTDGDDTDADAPDLEDGMTAADVLAEDEVDGFVADFRVGEDEGEMGGTQTVYDGDVHIEFDQNGLTIEHVGVGDEWYEVAMDDCTVEHREEGQDDGYIPITPFRGVDPATMEVTETTTVEGQGAYVVEDADTRTFISAETGYRLREEWGENGQADLHSWGETEPISAPDGDCEQDG